MIRIYFIVIVELGVQIDELVEIGLYVIVGLYVMIGVCMMIGLYSVIEGYMMFGEDNCIGYYVLVGGCLQDMKYKDELMKFVIGNCNMICEFMMIYMGIVQDVGVMMFGDDNWIMVYVYIGYDCCVGNNVILLSNVQMVGYVEIGDFVIIGGMLGVYQFVCIGVYLMLGGVLVFVQDILLFVIVVGNKVELYGINVEGLCW